MKQEPKGERLHKVLAHAGIASRRKCEVLIREGRVRVNGEIVREMGVKVDLSKDEVAIDNERIRAEPHVYLLLYKPRGVICTTDDQWGRKTILDLLPAHRRLRLFTVGRLEIDSEGLVIVTNDGDFAHEVLHPRRGLPRTYWVKVRGVVGPEIVARAREGVWLSDGKTPPMDVQVIRAGREVSTAKCTLAERHHHQLKRIWSKLGTPVQRMVLVRIASIGTEDLKKGRARSLTPAEVEELRSGRPGTMPERPSRRRPAAPPKSGPVGWGAPAGVREERGERRAKRPPRKAPYGDQRPPPRRPPPQRPPKPRDLSDRPPPPSSSSGRVFRNRGRKS
jgi:23S rRNA pseudouridine2605 synthase